MNLPIHSNTILAQQLYLRRPWACVHWLPVVFSVDDGCAIFAVLYCHTNMRSNKVMIYIDMVSFSSMVMMV